MRQRMTRAAALALVLAPVVAHTMDPAAAAAPAITSYTTTSGVVITSGPPGTQLVVTGTNFGPSGVGVLQFNGKTLSVNAWAATYIRVVVPTQPSYPTTGTFTVTTGGVTATGPSFTITGSGAPPPSPPPAPSISGYTSSSGAAITAAIAGSSIRINGANLGSSGSVTFNGITASTTAWSGSSVTAIVPNAGTSPATGPVKVTTGGQTATGPNFTINPVPAALPSISGYQANGTATTSAVPGTAVLITGANLGTSGTVQFNGIVAATANWTATAITVTVPAASSYPSTGPVTVTVGGQTATGPTFTITAPAPPPPAISGYQSTGGSAITSAAPGAQVVIVGSNLGTAGTVQFNGISAAAVSWTATAITVTVPSAGSYPNTGPVTVTTGGRTASGPSFTINAPPPPPPAITGYQSGGSAISSAASGTSVVIVGTNLGSSGSVTFDGITASTTAWTATAITVTVPTAASYPSTGPVVATTGGVPASGPSFTIVAPPTGTGGTVRNVRSYGATGNGTTDDSAAIQSALDAASPGDSIYFPAGTYHLGSTLEVRTSNVRYYGDGDPSIISGDTTQIHLFNTYNTNGLTGLRFDHLHLVGAGVFDKVLNQGAGISLGLATGTQISNCTIDGCGDPVIEGAGSGSTTVSYCLIENWGRTGMFMNGGDSALNTTFAQHDPNVTDEVTSHAIYIHSGAANCTITGCSFSGVRYYAIQVYGHDTGTTITGIQISGNQFSDNSQDIEVESGGPDISGITITGNSFWRTKGPSVQLKEGTGMHVDGNQFHDLNAPAVEVGNWAPYDVGASLSNVTVNNNTHTQSGGTPIQYVYYISGTNGSLSGVTVQGNSADGIQEPGTYHAAGIYLIQMSGATVANNTLTLASGGGSANVCAGVEVASGCSGLQISGNTINGSGNQYAYGVYAVGLSASSAITNNTCNHCQLVSGGATTSGNTVSH